MRALHVSAAGQGPSLGDVPVPIPGEGDVLVRVKAAGLNPFDNAVAAGLLTAMAAHEYPVVLGRDAAGFIEAVGPGVSDLAVGDEVLGHVLFVPPIQHGTLAEFAVLPARAVALKPAGLDFTTAAAIPLAGAAAVTAVDALDVRAGETVLVNGASGGVGSYAIQILAARGATVIATGGWTTDAERLMSHGADEVIDRTAGPVADQVRAAHPDGVDALVNVAGFTDDDVPLAALRPGGRVATTTGAPGADALGAAGLTGQAVMASPTRDVVAPLAEQAAAGTLAVHIAAVLPFESASEGLAMLASGGAHGKIVITIGD